jgi:hypothetical protein
MGFAALALLGSGASAFEIEAGVPELRASWETTVKYGAMFRLENREAELIDRPPSTVNQDDGNRNFGVGPVSTRVDVYTEADVLYRGFGARVSAAGWYDAMYFRANDNDSRTANAYTVPHNQFPKATQKLHGGNVELLDAFVFGSVGDTGLRGSFRAGKHALIWGESLFFGNNGIAGGQVPVDVVKLLSVPTSQFKEVIRPVGQVSTQLQLTSSLSIVGYYQYRWRRSVLPGVGSYFSTSDLVDAGGERILSGPPLVPNGGPAAFFREADDAASDSGQGGLSVRLRLSEVDLGAYAIRWHSKSPQVYLRPGLFTPPSGAPVVLDPSRFNPAAGQIGTYQLVFHENARTYGMSASTSIGNVNVAAEVSVRRNAPLVSSAQVVRPGMPADNNRHPLYAVGNTIHAQTSVIWALSPNAIARSSTLVAEVAANWLSSISRNPVALDPNAGRGAISIRAIYEPMYRQVLAGLDVSVPVGGSYTSGRSPAVAGFGVHRGGELTIALAASYLERYRFAVNYTHYHGPVRPALDDANHFTFSQALADRDFVSISARTTF